jgi:hypothetical protein
MIITPDSRVISTDDVETASELRFTGLKSNREYNAVFFLNRFSVHES